MANNVIDLTIEQLTVTQRDKIARQEGSVAT